MNNFSKLGKQESAKFLIRKACPKDAEAICTLYHKIYDKSYPLPFGTDFNFTKEALQNKKKWMVFLVVSPDSSKVIGVINLEVDNTHELAIIQGLVIDLDHRKGNLGSKLVREASQAAFKFNKSIQSVYGTARVINKAPQKICLQSGYKAYGFYPNMYYINDFESMALIVKHRKETLANRASGYWIPSYLEDIYRSANKIIGSKNIYPCRETYLVEKKAAMKKVHIEDYQVNGEEKLKNEFFTPLFKMTHRVLGPKGETLYLYINPYSKHASIIGGSTLKISSAFLFNLINELKLKGINYIQTYIRADQYHLMNKFVAQSFIPSAIYPAMKKIKGSFYDYIVFSYTNESVDLSQVTFEKSFYPYVESYLKLLEFQN